MAHDPRTQRTDRPRGRARLVRMAIVFVLVVVVAALLGRFGTNIDGGPATNIDGASAVDVEQSAPTSPAG